MNSKLIAETYCLRRKYYRFKQFTSDYQAKINDFEIKIPIILIEAPEKDEVLYNYLNSLKQNLSKMFKKLEWLKTELSKLPHIPNKSERKKIRQLKINTK